MVPGTLCRLVSPQHPGRRVDASQAYHAGSGPRHGSSAGESGPTGRGKSLVSTLCAAPWDSPAACTAPQGVDLIEVDLCTTCGLS